MKTFEFTDILHRYCWWDTQLGCIGKTVFVDCETTMSVAGSTPEFVIGGACSDQGTTVHLLRYDHISAFLQAHSHATFVMHNAAFDVQILNKETSFDFDGHVRSNRLLDTGLLYQLLELAKNGQVPPRWSLDHVYEKLSRVKLVKDENIRTGFGRHHKCGAIDYASMTHEEIVYLARDVLATRFAFQRLIAEVKAISPKFLLSHKIQLMGALGLAAVERNGICIDMDLRNVLLSKIDGQVSVAKSKLVDFGYVQGAKGNEAVLQAQLSTLEQNTGAVLPRTSKSGKISSKLEDLEAHRAANPFVDCFLGLKETRKLRDFLLKLDERRIYTSFTVLVNSGRTSSRRPNIQNLPRGNMVRECFVPSPGHVFVDIDYKAIELCALAQVCIDKFGKSRLGELINEGVDPHRWFAAALLKKPEAEVTKDERQHAKAANFGFPGGLGIERFLHYAATSYGVTLTQDAARALKNKWLESFPEMKMYLANPLHQRFDFSQNPIEANAEIAAGVFKRIISGETCTRNGERYSESLRNWALRDVLPHFIGSVADSGSQELCNEISRESITTRTGRVRANCSFCEARNAPFQGLAADGAKIALYRLARRGFRVVAFVHDEFLIEVPHTSSLKEICHEIEKTCVDAMRAVIPSVQIQCEWVVMNRWYKEAESVYTGDGNPVVFSRELSREYFNEAQ